MNKQVPRREFVRLAVMSSGYLTLAGSPLMFLGGCKTPGASSKEMAADNQRGSAASKIRMRVDDPANAANLALYSKAVKAMKSTPFPLKIKDENGNDASVSWWEAHAYIHLNDCPHGNWFFLPWHRAYLAHFENICRAFCKDNSFALPYWDWSVTPGLPAGFWGGQDNPLFNKNRGVQTTSKLKANVSSREVLDKITNLTDFFAFASNRSSSTQPPDGEGGTGQLEGVPHNNVHMFVGGNDGDMGTFLSPLDPIFWCHHANVDRLWAIWQSKMTSIGKSTLPPAPPSRGKESKWTSDFWLKTKLGNFYKIDAQNKPKLSSSLVSEVQTCESLGYQYDTLVRPTAAHGGTPARSRGPEPELRTSTIDISFASPRAQMHGPVTASPRSEPNLVFRSIARSAPLQAALTSSKKIWDVGGSRNLRLHVSGISKPDNAKIVSVEAFLAKDGPLTPADPSYAGGYTFFANKHHHHDAGHGASTPTIMFDLRGPLMEMKNRDRKDLFSESAGPIEIYLKMTIDGTDIAGWDNPNLSFSIELDS